MGQCKVHRGAEAEEFKMKPFISCLLLVLGMIGCRSYPGQEELCKVIEERNIKPDGAVKKSGIHRGTYLGSKIFLAWCFAPIFFFFETYLSNKRIHIYVQQN